MSRRTPSPESSQSIPEMADDVTHEETRQMYRDGKLTAYGRRMSKFLERALPDEKVDEWGWSLSRKERTETKRRAAEKKAAEEKKKAEAHARAAYRRKQVQESEVPIATLPADQQEPARKGWEKVLRPFKRREPWL